MRRVIVAYGQVGGSAARPQEAMLALIYGGSRQAKPAYHLARLA